MPAISASAPGKIILFGEHAVVYGRPAIAVPVNQVMARAVAMADPRQPAGSVFIQAVDIGLESSLSELPPDHPLVIAVKGVLDRLEIPRPPAFTLRISSTIPMAAGLGSGAAVSVAIIRVVSAFLGHPLANQAVSDLAYEVEKHYHGTPSGIDNTVITYNMPVYFVRGHPVETFHVASPFTLVIGDSGVKSPTAIAVGDLRKLWQADPIRYEKLFDQTGQIAEAARRLIEGGQTDDLGPLMQENHRLLQEMGVSSPELDRLIEVAQAIGALGAKLSGGGRGGNMIALVEPQQARPVAEALRRAGAVQTIITQVK